MFAFVVYLKLPLLSVLISFSTYVLNLTKSLNFSCISVSYSPRESIRTNYLMMTYLLITLSSHQSLIYVHNLTSLLTTVRIDLMNVSYQLGWSMTLENRIDTSFNLSCIKLFTVDRARFLRKL